jgi:hypothetical protein
MYATSRLTMVAVAALTLAGCVGSVGDSAAPTAPGNRPPSGGTGTGGDPPPGGAGGAGGGGAGGEGGAPAACAGEAAAVPWQSTLLTRQQYINSVSDLLGFDVAPHVMFDDSTSRKSSGGVALAPLEVEQRQVTAEAIAAVAASAARLAGVLPCPVTQAGDAACITQFIDQFGRRAFRRPLTPAATAALRKLFDGGTAAGGPPLGVEWVIAGVLQAPDFLYQTAPRPAAATAGKSAPLDSYTVASRLAFFLWNSAPDAELLAAADANGLRGAAAIEAQIKRLLAHPRAARARTDFHMHWLKLGQLDQISREAAEFTPGLARDLQRSLLAGIEELYRGGGKVEILWTTGTIHTNELVSRVYGLPPAADQADLKPAAAPADQRRGLLTHPSLMTVLAHPDSSDPIHRGVFVMEELLCETMPDPAPGVPDLPPLRPGLTTRQRLEDHRSKPACAGCHALFDPMGMAFENYDQIGRHRKLDQGVAVDSSGEILPGSDLSGKFDNGFQLIDRISKSGAIRDCMARRWMEYALRRGVAPGERCAEDGVKRRFRESGDLVGLLSDIAGSELFRTTVSETP